MVIFNPITRRAVLKSIPLLAAPWLASPPGAMAAASTLPPLRVSANGRYLTAGGKPFFWLGDTAWDIFYKLTVDEARTYFEDRKRKGFNVALAIVLNGAPHTPNLAGDRPLVEAKPGPLPFNPQPNEAFFEHADKVVALGNGLGFYMGLVPMWGNNIALFDASGAEQYGRFLGKRYANASVVWLAGGDTNPPAEMQDRWRALGNGLKTGSDGRALVTFHPNIGSSCTWFHNESWLDFDSNQSGHARVRPEATAIYALIERCYMMQPPKPVIDLESGYERIPVGLNQGRTNDTVVSDADRLNAYDLRVRAYQTVFAGCFGYNYGAYDVISFRKQGDTQRWPPNQLWTDALQLPGASQLRHLRTLMESVPVENREPAQELLATPAGWKYDRLEATGDRNGRWFLIYSTSGRSFSVNMEMLKGGTVTATWFDPRTGQIRDAGRFPNSGTPTFTPPTSTPNVPKGGVIQAAVESAGDWVLTLTA